MHLTSCAHVMDVETGVTGYVTCKVRWEKIASIRTESKSKDLQLDKHSNHDNLNAIT